MNSSTTLPPLAVLYATLGALEIGAFFAMFLFGLSAVQTYIYFTKYRDDPLPIKALVCQIH
jgi:hypothetical protein